MLVKRKDMDLKTSCGECKDWYSDSDPVDHRSVHPVQPGEDLSNVKICKLSFELLKNSLNSFPGMVPNLGPLPTPLCCV
jgi:hypothetical protein